MIKEQLITRIIQTMSNTLDKLQLSQLTEVLATTFRDVEMEPTNNALTVDLATNEKLVQTYFVCQKINGMADSTIKAYRFTLMKFINKILSFAIGGNPLPSGGGRSLVNL